MKRLLVIGGGLCGLSAAWHARRAGCEVRLLESSERVGGVVRTIRENGCVLETGPNSMAASRTIETDLLRALGLENEIVYPSSQAKKRFVMRGGSLLPAPMSPGDFISTRLLSFAGKLRILLEPFISKRPDTACEESIAIFVRRRLGPEALTFLAEPFVSGVYAGDPEKLSLRHAFPRLYDTEQKYGSLLRPLISTAFKRRKANSPSANRSIFSFRDGMEALPRALASGIGAESIIYRANLTKLERTSSNQWQAAWEAPSGTMREIFDAVVIAIPAHKIANLPIPAELLKSLFPLSNIPHPHVAAIAFGYPKNAVGHPLDGFGVLIPAVEQSDVLGVIFNSSLFPNRAPEGHVLLTAFLGGTRRPELATLPDDKLVFLASRNLEKILRIKTSPSFSRIFRWPLSIPQCNIGHGEILKALDLVEKEYPSLAFAGNYRSGVSVGQCLETGRAAAAHALNESLSTAT